IVIRYVTHQYTIDIMLQVIPLGYQMKLVPVFTLDMPMERIINLLKCPCDFPLTPRISYNLTTYRIRVSLIGTYGDFLATICQKCSLPFFVISSGISILTIGIKLIPFKHIWHLASFLTAILYSRIPR